MVNKSAFKGYPKKKYVMLPAYFRSDVSKPPTHFSKLHAFISEIISEFVKKDYEFIESQYLYAIQLKGTAQLKEIVSKYGKVLKYLRIILKSPNPNAGALDAIIDCRDLIYFNTLKSLSISCFLELHNASALEKIKALRTLDLEPVIDQKIDFTKLPALRELSFTANQYTQDLSSAKHITHLGVHRANKKYFPDFSSMENLKQLNIVQSNGFENLHPFAECENVNVLFLHSCNKITDLQGIERLKNITHLIMESCSQLTDIDNLLNAHKLEYLEIRDCKKLKDVAIISQLVNLKNLYLFGFTKKHTSIDNLIKNMDKLRFYFAM